MLTKDNNGLKCKCEGRCMAKKIRISIQEEHKHINLPALPIGLAFIALNVMLKHGKMKNQEWIQNLDEKQLKTILKTIKSELKACEPFTLIDVVSKDATVEIKLI